MPRRKHRRERVQRRKAGPTGRRDAFRCVGCRLDVPAGAPGTEHRNHCPHCLTSLHLDGLTPGDRRAGCGGRMVPLSLTVRPDGEWMLIHHCLSCGGLSVNRIAGDDNALALLRIAVRPLRDERLRAGLRRVG
ncbi:RNHCP domain-containing protein [Actinomadura chibensis]|uniref:RNHCP domain-containing protein n=1 Tax=Actinomadura chibensis TaxID=392828 RepID=A0A5D0NUL8_9ACTN|nr:RNHCP domain-containing protein [Actinomadura chibensis]TYB47942.1 RNHCP domain-containing protein [Actinomadura chibensis]